MTPEKFFKIPRRKKSTKAARFIIGKFDPNKNQTSPRGYDSRGYASGVSGNGNVVGFPTADVGTGDVGGVGMGESIDLVPSQETCIKEENTPYKYGCILMAISDAISDWLSEWSKRNIPESDLYIDPDTGMNGYETDHHISLLYGLGDINADEIDGHMNDAVSMIPEFDLGEVSRFSTNDNFDVIKVAIPRGLLDDMHSHLSSIPHEKIHSEFNPHITLAYVKKGTCPHLDGNKDFIGIKDKPQALSYCDRFGDSLEYIG